VGNTLWAFDTPGLAALRLADSSTSEILAFYRETSGGIVAGALLSLLPIALFVIFASGVRRVLMDATGDDVLATTAFVGALLGMAAGHGAETLNMVAALRARAKDLDAALGRSLFDISQVLGFNAASVGLGPFLVAVAAAAQRGGTVLPRPVVLVAALVGISLLTPLSRVTLAPSILVVLLSPSPFSGRPPTRARGGSSRVSPPEAGGEMSEEALRKSAIEQAALVRSGEVSSRELVEASLAAIDRLNPDLNAFVTMCAERALAEADTVQPGDERPLAGVPIAIKDILALTEGVRTTFGSAVTGDWVPPLDSSVVRRLRGAGGIVVGKTNVPELGILPITEPHRFGPTRNPWNTARTPGGSSGGSAAAVAAGMLSLAHGNDGGGSIRIPAACCGLVGLKPTRGRVSVSPIPNDTIGLVSDGVLSWTVAETALALDLLSGYEPGDPFALPSPPDGFAAAAEREPGMLRIGYAIEAPNDAAVEPEHAAAVERTAELLESLGHRVEEAQVDFNPGPFMENFLRLWVSEVGANVRSLAAIAGGEVDREALEPLTRQMAAQAEQTGAVDYISAIGYLRLAARMGLQFFTDHDVLVTPVLAQPPLEIGALDPEEGEEPIVMLAKSGDFVPFTPPANVTGQPAMSLPLAHSEAGLPIGVQFTGAHGGDATLLSLAAQLERAQPWADRRPSVGAAA